MGRRRVRGEEMGRDGTERNCTPSEILINTTLVATPTHTDTHTHTHTHTHTQ